LGGVVIISSLYNKPGSAVYKFHCSENRKTWQLRWFTWRLHHQRRNPPLTETFSHSSTPITSAIDSPLSISSLLQTSSPTSLLPSDHSAVVNVSLFHYLPNLSILLCNLIFISHFNQTVNAVCFSMYKQKRINSCLNAVCDFVLDIMLFIF
jgi:hypothetical protein